MWLLIGVLISVIFLYLLWILKSIIKKEYKTLSFLLGLPGLFFIIGYLIYLQYADHTYISKDSQGRKVETIIKEYSTFGWDSPSQDVKSKTRTVYDNIGRPIEVVSLYGIFSKEDKNRFDGYGKNVKYYHYPNDSLSIITEYSLDGVYKINEIHFTVNRLPTSVTYEIKGENEVLISRLIKGRFNHFGTDEMHANTCYYERFESSGKRVFSLDLKSSRNCMENDTSQLCLQRKKYGCDSATTITFRYPQLR